MSSTLESITHELHGELDALIHKVESVVSSVHETEEQLVMGGDAGVRPRLDAVVF
jgi:hypothetical protein